VREGSVVTALEAAGASVDHDGDWDHKVGPVDAHAGQSVDGFGAAEDQHSRHNEAGQQTEEEEHHVRCRAPARVHDLEHRVDSRALALDLDGEDGKQEHLDRGARGMPEGPRHAVVPRSIGRLEQGCGPCPLGHDVGGGQAGEDGAPGRGKDLGAVAGLLVLSNASEGPVPVDLDECREGASECNADHPADGSRERRLQSTQGNERGWRAETSQLSTVRSATHSARACVASDAWRSAGPTSSPSPSPKKEHFPSYDLPSKVLYLRRNAQNDQDHQSRHKAFGRGRGVGEKKGG